MKNKTTKPDAPMRSGYTRVVDQDGNRLYYVKDGKRYRRFGNVIVEML